MQEIAFPTVVAELDFLFSGGSITGKERQAYIDRMTSMENTPWQIHAELEQRFLTPEGHGTINGNDGSNDGSGSQGPSGLKLGGMMLPIAIGAPLLWGLGLRLAGVLVRTGSVLSIPWKVYKAFSPATKNAIQVAAIGTGLYSEEIITEKINEMMAQGDEEAPMIEVTGTEAELQQLETGGNGAGPLSTVMNGSVMVPGLGNLPPGVWIVKQWKAPRIGGVQFYKFSNGLIAVQKLDGTWKVYRPKKPIVLYAGVGNNRRSIMRAAHIVRAEVKAWKSMEKFFGLHRRKALPAPKRGRSVVIEHGSGSIVAD